MTKRTFAAATVLLCGMSGMALAQTGAMHGMKTSGISAADKTFMIKAAQGGMGEVALGNLAVQHGSSAAVKHFGQRMVTDHTKANGQLMQVAAREGVTLPKSPGPEERKAMTKLSALSGSAFDHAYASDMVEDHVKDVADFQKETREGKDPAVRAFAAKTLPTLQMHLHMAQAMKSGKTTH